MALQIPGLSTLYAILKRDIEHQNNQLRQRKELAKELHENCRKWSDLLVNSFSTVFKFLEANGKEAAEKEINSLMSDFLELNYRALEKESPIIRFLRKDKRFKSFAETCIKFYNSALDIKWIVYGEVEAHHGLLVDIENKDLDDRVRIYQQEVRAVFERVNYAYMETQIIRDK